MVQSAGRTKRRAYSFTAISKFAAHGKITSRTSPWTFPRKITVFTGVSGAGKSSLVFDTIAAESQQLLNEIFSAFIQTLLPRYGQPDADR